MFQFQGCGIRHEMPEKGAYRIIGFGTAILDLGMEIVLLTRVPI